jgi:ribosomal-protein-alanine N-acetyltransferase
MRFSALPESDHSLIEVRPITAADIPRWFMYLTDPAVYEHTSWNVESPEELMHCVWSASTAEPASSTRFAIALRATGHLVGTAGFHTVSPQNRSAELAYDLAPPYWGKGIASYVCLLLTQWAHERCDVLRVQATALLSNQRSVKVLVRCGFECEGLLRSYRLVRGVPGDFWLYSHVVPIADSPVVVPDGSRLTTAVRRL